ncbi:hypothetical protein TrVFT333_002614 [Trichoderma virens FT-333]|nr:hypothetical protein TrVFT333_002614 [Trichoderma virens FT-333]
MKDAAEAGASSKRSGRRKACDLCCQKKIRCNGAKPRCSQCQIYDSECMYNGVRRRAIPRVSSAPRVESLEARVNRVESMLEGLMAQIDTSSKRDGIEPTIEDIPKISPLSSGQEDEWTLPPLLDILPIVEDYFQSTNRLLPLFDQTTFMQMLRSWYSTPFQRDPATWASINVVLALGLLLQPPVATQGSLTLAALVKNTQSVLDEIVSREEDILSAQIVLGLCIIFQESPDPQPASVLAATAVTLVHRLRLYSRPTQANLSQTDIRQRNRLFWIVYVLDKNISLRAQHPPLLSDAWTDIDLPESDPIDGAGVVYSRQGPPFVVESPDSCFS